MMPLTLASKGTTQTIKKVRGNDETRLFLESLGFVVGSEVFIISECCGNIIVNIMNSRIAISKEMAAKIMV